MFIFSDGVCVIIGTVCILQCSEDQVSPAVDIGNAMARI